MQSPRWHGAFAAFQPASGPQLARQLQESCRQSDETELSEEERDSGLQAMHDDSNAHQQAEAPLHSNHRYGLDDSLAEDREEAVEERSSGSAEEERGTLYGALQPRR